MSETVKLPSGRYVSIPGASTMAPEELEQRVRQAERALRVETAANDMLDKGYMGGRVEEEPGLQRVWDQATTAAGEFGRNLTGGLSENFNALLSYPLQLLPGEDPLEGLSFTERRDAFERGQDIRAEELPGWLDNTASIAGALSMGVGPGMRGVAGWKDAAAMGATIGGLEGVGNSDAQDLPGVLADGGIGTGVGAAVGAGSDILLDKVVGGAARSAFARPGNESAMAYEAQDLLGVPPSVGSIGNHTARVLENAFAQAPMTAGINAMLPEGPVIGRALGPLRERQTQLLNDAMQDQIVGPMRPPNMPAADNDAALNVRTSELANIGRQRMDDEIANMETDFARLVDPRTPVPMTGVRAVPDDVRAQGQSENLAERIQTDINMLDKNMVRAQPIDANLHGQLNAQKGTAQGRLQQMEAQLARIKPGGANNTQIANLNRAINRERATIADLDRKIYDNLGPPMAAIRQDRGQIGKQTEQGGLSGYEAKLLYGPVNQALADAAGNARGPAAKAEFLKMMERETEIFGDKEVLAKFADATTSTNYGKIRNAVTGGNWDELDVLMKNLTPDETSAFQADIIEMLGRNQQAPFSPSEFRKNWMNRVPPEVKDRLFAGNPQGRALTDALAEVADDFVRLGRDRNSSNSASAGSVMAGIGAAVALPGKIIPFLTVTLGMERAVASEALAKAVAGQPTELGQLLRRALVVEAGRQDLMRSDEGGAQ